MIIKELFKIETIHLIFKYTIVNAIHNILDIIISINNDITIHFIKYDLINMSEHIIQKIMCKKIFVNDFKLDTFTTIKNFEKPYCKFVYIA